MIPPGWRYGRLKWDTRMMAGGTPATDESSYWLDGDDPDGVPFVAIGDMSQRKLVQRTAQSISHAGMTSKNMPLGVPGTILLAMYASVGEVAVLDLRATWNQAILGITPNPSRVDARFLTYALRSIKNDLLGEVRSNTQSNLNARQVGEKPGVNP